MNSIKIFLFIFISFLTLSFNRIIAQEDQFMCGTNQKEITDPGQLKNTTWTLKVLLVEFQNVTHKLPGYTFTDFNNLFFSTGIYASPNMYSPDGEQVSGSMKDYLNIMSDGEFNLTGYVVNDDENDDGRPDWLTLPLRKGQYDSSSYYTFYNAAIVAANNAGLNISTSSTTKLAIIYAGHTYRGGGLNPRAFG